MLLLALLLLALLPPLGCSRTADRDVSSAEGHEEVAVTTRPHIYYCRSPNMEDFTCWWHPLDNLTEGEQVAYVLRYSKDKGSKHECPDYVSAGPHSCHFDSSHTTIWKIYCMTVTAVTSRRNYTSQEHCLDVTEIVQTEAPVNLSYVLTDAGGHEVGHDVLLSWTYPAPADLQYGWITLLYELQYRRLTEPDNWKVKRPLREPRVELLSLPVGDYLVRVRCRSHNYGLWSRWSSELPMSVPARPPAGKLLVRILVSGVGVVALLLVVFGVIPQSRRIKDYFLPPVPKPRIIGINALLLKKGNLEEINHHLSNFHSYSPPSYTEEVWDQVSADGVSLSTPKDCGVPVDGEDTSMVLCDPPGGRCPLEARGPVSYVQSLSPYCSSPPDAFASSPWPRPGAESLPGAEYSMTGRPNAVPAPDATYCSPQDFYTCVQLMNESGKVHLVPCLPPAYCREFPPPPRADVDAGQKEEEKKKQAGTKVMNRPKDGGEAEGSEASDPLLPGQRPTQIL